MPAAGSTLRTAAARAPKGRGWRPETKAVQLRRYSDQLDNLIRDAEIGATSHREFERQAAEAEAIAAGVRAVFRGRPARPSAAGPVPVHPPIFDDGKGKAAW
jgi:hypothetical protein